MSAFFRVISAVFRRFFREFLTVFSDKNGKIRVKLIFTFGFLMNLGFSLRKNHKIHCFAIKKKQQKKPSFPKKSLHSFFLRKNNLSKTAEN
jgi:hypothetical protein